MYFFFYRNLRRMNQPPRGRAVGNFSELDVSVRLVFVQAFFLQLLLVQLHLWLAVHELLSTFPVQEFFWYPPPPFTRAMYTLPLEKLLTLEATDLVYPNEFSYFFCNL